MSVRSCSHHHRLVGAWFLGVVSAVALPAMAQRDDEPDRRFLDAIAELALFDVFDHWREAAQEERSPSLVALMELTEARRSVHMATDSETRAAALERLMDAHDHAIDQSVDAPERALLAIDRLRDLRVRWLEREGLLHEALVGILPGRERESLERALHRLRRAADEAELLADRAGRRTGGAEGIRLPPVSAGELALARSILATVTSRSDAPHGIPRGADDRMVDLFRLLEARRALDAGETARVREEAERVAEDGAARSLDRLVARLLLCEAAWRATSLSAVRSSCDDGAGDPALAEAIRAVGAFGELLTISSWLRTGRIWAERVEPDETSQAWKFVAERVESMVGSVEHAHAGALRASVRRRLAEILPPSPDWRGWPIIVRVAEGERLLREGRPEETITLLHDILLARGIHPLDTREAVVLLMESWLLLGQPAQALRAVDQLLLSGVDLPDRSAFAEQAARLAIRHTELLRSESDGSILIRRALEQRITLAADAEERDRWRLRAADHAWTEGDHEWMERLSSSVTSPGELRAWAAQTRVRAAALQLSDQGIDGAMRRLTVVRTARGEVDRALTEASPEDLPGVRLAAQELLLEEASLRLDVEGGASALALLGELAEEVDPSFRPLLMRVRIAAHRAMGREGEAESDLAELLSAGQDDGSALLIPMLTDALARVRRTEDEESAAAAERLARRDLSPLAQLADTRIDAESAPVVHQLLVAEALRRSGHAPGALVRLEALHSTHPDVRDVLFELAETLIALRAELEEAEARAFAHYRRIVAAGVTGEEDTMYWTAQLRLIEIAERSGTNAAQLAPRIRRLRLQDERMGGGTIRRGFEAIEARAAGR